MRRAHRESIRLMSLALVALGLMVVVLTVAQGGGPLARGVVVGVVLAALGAGRLLLSRRSPPSPEHE